MTTTLNFTRDNFDQDNTFVFSYTNRIGCASRAKGYLADFGDEGIYIMKTSACLKSSYTQKDMEESSRLDSMKAVCDGDIVEVAGKQYTVKILGNYSDAGRLIPVSQ